MYPVTCNVQRGAHIYTNSSSVWISVWIQFFCQDFMSPHTHTCHMTRTPNNCSTTPHFHKLPSARWTRNRTESRKTFCNSVPTSYISLHGGATYSSLPYAPLNSRGGSGCGSGSNSNSNNHLFRVSFGSRRGVHLRPRDDHHWQRRPSTTPPHAAPLIAVRSAHHHCHHHHKQQQLL